MSGSHWKTGSPLTRSERVLRLMAGQVLRQLGIVVLALVVWSGLFAGYLSAVGVQVPTPVATQPKSIARGPTRTPLSITQPTLAPTSAPATVTSAPSPTLPAIAPANPTSTSAPATNTPIPATPTSAPAVTSKSSAVVSFSKDVLPILERVCVKCHGGENTEAGLVLKTYADVMKGSENGPVVTPGKSVDSLLIELISNGKMPKRGPKLLPAEIRVITQWVDAGAPNN